MRKLIGAGLVAMLAGCGAAESPSGDETGDLTRRCPDPQTDCTMSNGTGVYTAEDGYAGIDNYKLMITDFINHGSYVSFQGRYFNAQSNLWLPLAGGFYYANYQQKTHLLITAVSEKATIPTWTLLDNTTNTTITVTGSQLLQLQLIIVFNDPNSGASRLYELSFNGVATDLGKQPVRKFNLRWRPADTTQIVAPMQYCFDASNHPDEVVFQQGLLVNPVTALVTRNSNTDGIVTLSCRLGAIATVHWWGYPYRAPSNTFYFDAGLQMKRASYCADAKHYTVAGTQIHIADDQGIENDPIPSVEAWWTPHGATCIGTRRHPNPWFDGTCQGQALPQCPTLIEMQQSGQTPYLGDGP